MRDPAGAGACSYSLLPTLTEYSFLLLFCFIAMLDVVYAELFAIPYKIYFCVKCCFANNRGYLVTNFEKFGLDLVLLLVLYFKINDYIFLVVTLL